MKNVSNCLIQCYLALDQYNHDCITFSYYIMNLIGADNIFTFKLIKYLFGRIFLILNYASYFLRLMGNFSFIILQYLFEF